MIKLLINHKPAAWIRMCRTIGVEEREYLTLNSTADMDISDDGGLNLYALFDDGLEYLASEYVLKYGEFEIKDWASTNNNLTK